MRPVCDGLASVRQERTHADFAVRDLSWRSLFVGIEVNGVGAALFLFNAQCLSAVMSLRGTKRAHPAPQLTFLR